MKTKLILTIALLASMIGVNAQFYPGPATGPAIDYSTAVFIVPGITTTNVASAYQKLIPVGPLGVGFQIEIAGTNATTTTNATITMEGTVDGTYWIDTPTTALPVFTVPQSGTSPYTVYTNMPATSANLGNLRWLRIKSIQNTNTGSIFITNMTWSVR